jgi:hypothetical protein
VRLAVVLLIAVLSVVGLWYAATHEDAPAAPALSNSTSGLVTRPHATRPLSDAKAAQRVRRSSFEPRPQNRASTHRMPTKAQLRAFRAQSTMPYAKWVTGHFTGTTDEVIQWAAIKWGFAPDLLRAVGSIESRWKMSFVGDNGDSFGLYQVRRPYHCKEPVCKQFRSDAALNADYYGAIVRAYYDGKQTWLNDVAAENGKAYKRGDLWASVGAWYAGRWWTAPAKDYVARVQRTLHERTWRTPGFRKG